MSSNTSVFDVCVVCALAEEASAFMRMTTRLYGASFAQGFSEHGTNYEYRHTRIQNNAGEWLTLVVSWLPMFGPLETVLHLKAILSEFKPRFVAMTGSCVGNKQRVKLGDLVVAERAFLYETGKIVSGDDGQMQHLQLDTNTYGPSLNILQYVHQFDGWRPIVATLPYPDSKPEPLVLFSSECHIEPIASGSAIRSDDLFRHLPRPVRSIVAIDMEGADFYRTTAAFPGVHSLLVKGVSDYGDSSKDDTFHEYAALASAVYVLCFIREYVTTDLMPKVSRPFHEQLRYERELRGLSQKDLAEQLGCHAGAVGRWESGEALPQPYYLQKIYTLFGKNAQEMGILLASATPKVSELPSENDSLVVLNTSQISDDRTVTRSRPFHEHLRYERGLRGLSQSYLAEQLGCSEKTVGRWERGESIPQPFYLQKIYALFGKNAQEMGILPVREDWGGAPDVTQFFGRDRERTLLRAWITFQECGVVSMLGGIGVGKTTLAVKLVQQIKGEFEYVFWRSLQNAPPLMLILKECVWLISDQQAADTTEDIDEQISALLLLLRTRRCLLILDNVESILQPGLQRAGQYRKGYEAYGKLIKQMGEIQHQSCLLLTSREKLREVTQQESQYGPVRSLILTGIGRSEGYEILKQRDLLGTDEQVTALINLYSGNPLALQLIARFIHEIFGGDIAQFLQEEDPVVGDIIDLLDLQSQYSFDPANIVDPNFANVYYKRGLSYENSREYQNALANFDKSLLINPNNVDVYESKGTILGYLRKYQEAITAFNRAARLNPEKTGTYSRQILVILVREYSENLIPLWEKLSISLELLNKQLYHLYLSDEVLKGVDYFGYLSRKVETSLILLQQKSIFAQEKGDLDENRLFDGVIQFFDEMRSFSEEAKYALTSRV